MLRFTPALYSDPTNLKINLVACKPTTKHLISHCPSFIGALNSTRSSLNTTRRVYFYVIVKMWFKLPIYRALDPTVVVNSAKIGSGVSQFGAR